MMDARPLLNVYQAWILVFDNPFKHLGTIKDILNRTQASLNKSVEDATKQNTIAAHIASIRGLLSQPPIQPKHDPYAVLALFQEALRLFPPDEVKYHSGVHLGMAFEYMHLEDTKSALKASKDAYDVACAGDDYLIAIISVRNQAWITYHMGNLDQAIEICRKGITSFDQLRTENGQPFPGLGIVFIMLGYLYLEYGEFEKAEIELSKGYKLNQLIGEYEAFSLSLIGLTRLYALQGDHLRAMQLGERTAQRMSSLAALAQTLQIQIALSDFERDPEPLEPILIWMREHQPDFKTISDFQGITPWAETMHIAHLTWIQVKIALSKGRIKSHDLKVLLSCLDFLDQRLHMAEQHGLLYRVIECCIIKSLLLDVIGKTDEAKNTLTQALALAEPRNFCRVFLDKGQPMAQLLKDVTKHDPSNYFVNQLLDAFERLYRTKVTLLPQKLVEPLTERELEVLNLMAVGLTYNEIAAQITVSLNTVRTHVKNIYGKLDVHKRSQAIAKAKELNLL